MQIFNYRFKPRLIPTLATILLLPVLINLGLWQSHKADKKQLLQDIYEQRANTGLTQIDAEPVNVESIRYSKVRVSGKYEPDFQILIDNQVHNGQAGYFVITPLHINGTNMRVLVNRGWVPTGSDRNILPVIETPKDEVEVVGYAQDPSSKFIELMQTDTAKNTWQMVWQNFDIKRYKSVVTFQIQPITILLDPASFAGGYVRVWAKPDSGIDVNRGYAIQWYLMSIALIIIYIITNLKRVTVEGSVNAK